MAVLQHPHKQLGEAAVAEPGVALQTQHPEGGQRLQDVHIQLREAGPVQLQLPQRGQPCERAAADHGQMGVVPQPQFDQTPGLSKGPRGNFRQVVAPEIQEDQSGGGGEGTRLQLRQRVVPQVQIDQITVQHQEVRGDPGNPVVGEQKATDVQRDGVGDAGEPSADAVHSVGVWTQTAGWTTVDWRYQGGGDECQERLQPVNAW